MTTATNSTRRHTTLNAIGITGLAGVTVAAMATQPLAVAAFCLGVGGMGIYCSKRADVSEGRLKEDRDRWQARANREIEAHAETNLTLAMAQAENDQLTQIVRTHQLEQWERVA